MTYQGEITRLCLKGWYSDAHRLLRLRRLWPMFFTIDWELGDCMNE